MPLLKKLGVKEGLSIAVLGFADKAFLEGLSFDDHLKNEVLYDLIIILTPEVTDLRALPRVKRSLADRGAVWVIYPKGVKSVTQRQVMFAGNAEGFTDCKVCSFSAELTGLKFVRRRQPPR